MEKAALVYLIQAIDAACKAAAVEIVGKEKLGGGYVTVIIQGARPSEAVLSLLPK